MLKVCIAIAGTTLLGTTAHAIDKPTYDIAYELEGDVRPGRTVNYNDSFESREVRGISDSTCFYLSGKLRENRDPGRYPDTYLYMFDKDDNIVCQDNDSSSKGNGKASACYDVAPIPNGDDDNATIRLGITGRPDGVDAMFNGLFFNAPHGQLGEAEICITYFSDGGQGGPRGEEGNIIDTDTYLCTFVTGAEAFRVNYVVPEGTVLVDVEINNTTETFPICNDVDFYELDGLSEACDYAITVIGGTDQFCDPSCAILGWYDKNGGLVSVSPDLVDRNGLAGQGAQLSVISDANGRIRLAVSGENDRDFDSYTDPAPEAPRSIDTPGYEPPNVHGCCTCYTIKVQINKHIPDGETMPDGSENGTMLLLSNGDLNLDGGVDVLDLAFLLNKWGWQAP